MKKLIVFAAALTLLIPSLSFASIGPIATTGDTEKIEAQISTIQSEIDALTTTALGAGISNPGGSSSGGGGVSTTTANTWTAQQTFQSSTVMNGNATVSSTLTVNDATSANAVNVNCNTNTGSGASTNGCIFVNVSSDNGGIGVNINQENSSLSNAKPLLYINSGPPDNTVASGTQTLSSSTTQLNVASISGWPTSGYLLIIDSTSSSENANRRILQYTNTTTTAQGNAFTGVAGTFFTYTTPYTFTNGDRVTYVDNNDHQIKQEIEQHGLNGAATPLKINGTGNLGLQWTQEGGNVASGSGQFQLDLANNQGTDPQIGDVFRIEVRNQTNSSFNPGFGITGLQEGALTCFGDCQNYVTPWNAPWEGEVNIYPNSGNGSTISSTTPELVIRQPDTGAPDFIHAEASSGVMTFQVSANGNVSSTGNLVIGGNVGIGTPATTTYTLDLGSSGSEHALNYFAKGANPSIQLINTNDSATAAGQMETVYNSTQFIYNNQNNGLYIGQAFLGGNNIIGTTGNNGIAILAPSDLSTIIDDGNGHGGYATTTPTSNHGTVFGSDMGGRITTNAAGTSNTLTFTTAFTYAPVCFASVASGTAAYFSQIAPTTSNVVFTSNTSLVTSSVIQYICQGNPI